MRYRRSIAIWTGLLLLLAFGIAAYVLPRAQSNSSDSPRSTREYRVRIAAAHAFLRSHDIENAILNLDRASLLEENFELHHLKSILDCSSITFAAENSSNTGQRKPITDIACFSDGIHFVSCSHDQTLRLWAKTSANVLSCFKLDDKASTIAIDDGSKTIAVGLQNGDVQMISYETFENGIISISDTSKKLSTDQLAVHDLAFAPSRNLLLAACGNESEPGIVQAWQVDTGSVAWKLKGHKSPVRVIAIEPNEQRIASADDEIKIWGLGDGQLQTTLSNHCKAIHDLAFGPGNRLAYCSGDSIEICDLNQTKSRTHLFGHRGLVSSIEFSRDGKLLASGSADRTLRIWNVESGKSIGNYWGHYGSVAKCTFFPRTNHLVTTDGHHLKAWTLETGSRTMNAHQGMVNTVAAGPNEETMVTSGSDGQVAVWNTSSRKQIEQLSDATGMDVPSVDVAMDGEWIAWGTDRGQLWMANAAASKPLISYSHQVKITSVRFDPTRSRTFFSAAVDGIVRKWIIGDGAAESRLFAQFDGSVHGIDVSFDGQLVAIGVSNLLVLKDAESDETVLELEQESIQSSPEFVFQFDPTCQRLAMSEGSALAIWDVETATTIERIDDFDGSICAVSYSPDGSRLVAATDDGRILIFETKDWKLLLTLEDLPGGCRSLDFSADGNRLMGGMEDGTVVQWGLVSRNQ